MKVYTPLSEDIKRDDNLQIFLAGPIKGAPDWQSDFISEFKYEDVTFFNPRRPHSDNFVYEEQVAWEARYLDYADLVVFNIPPEAYKVEGRYYAQTTMVELSEMINKGKRVIINLYDEYPLKRYLTEKYPGKFVDSYKELITLVDKCIKAYNQRSRCIFFTSDTHFNQERSYKLSFSRHCFKDLEDMNKTFIRNWNNTVSNKDVIYHLGDFGDYSYRQYLKGNIFLLPGNYEHKDFPDVNELQKTLENKYDFDVVMTQDVIKMHLLLEGEKDLPHDVYIACMHEPTRKVDDVDFNLFGHIHGRQQIKKFGLDVGVDCQNFRPIEAVRVVKYYDAVKKGYYDENVWIQ